MSDDVFFEKNVVATDTKSAMTWQREKDSNPHIRSQSPLCYPYTIPLFCTALFGAKIIIRNAVPFVKHYFPKSRGLLGNQRSSMTDSSKAVRSWTPVSVCF